MKKTYLLYITSEISNQQVCKTLAELTFTTVVSKLTYKPTYLERMNEMSQPNVLKMNS